MFRVDWRNGFATGLILGGLTSVLIVFSGHGLYELVNCITQTECAQYASNDKTENEPEWWYWTRRLVAAEDTLAQWVMALFTIVAVALVWRTLNRTTDANEQATRAANAALSANQIMRQEQRPWVTLRRDTDCDFFELGFGCRVAWNCDFENLGKSPARNIRLKVQAIKLDNFSELKSAITEFSELAIKSPFSLKTPILFPGKTTEHWKYFSEYRMSYTPDKSDVEGAYTFLLVCLTYQLGAAIEDGIGVEARVLEIEPKPNFYGPFGHTMLEHANVRIIR